jgi:hypothetical protein
MITCPKCKHEFEAKLEGWVGSNYYIDGVEMKCFSCYGKTLDSLTRHINCCRKHYPNAVFGNIQLPAQSVNGHYTCKMHIPKATYCMNCPPINERECEEL